MPKPTIQILVCVNDRGPDSPKPCCAARAGLDVYHRLKDLVKERGLRDQLLVTRTGCLKHCSRGTTVAIWPDNHWYGHVGAGDAEEILEATIEGSGPIERLLMPPGPWE